MGHWLEILERRELISGLDPIDWIPKVKGGAELQPSFQVTPAGWAHVEKLFVRLGSTACFIAMSFGLPERQEVERAIIDACVATGWRATTVDRHEYMGGVMDKIIALINQARFVVADFTENKNGVYYEAGYAAGRGLAVIPTIKKGHMEHAHFDTKHLNYIVWETPEDLQNKLAARIGAIINR